MESEPPTDERLIEVFRRGDVQAVFLKVAHVLSEAGGGYVQESSVTGSGDTARTSLTLRVAARRLSDVLNQLRELGDVRGEQVTDEDVTFRVVDLEARLRDKQRVEVELPDLLEKRGDVPLREISDLRQALSDVRERIERLTVQRQHLGRLMSLAAVLVIIRSDTIEPGPERFTIGQYFADGMSGPWRKGLTLLADTCAFVVSVLVGVLIWWILLAVMVAVVWRYSRWATGSTTKS